MTHPWRKDLPHIDVRKINDISVGEDIRHIQLLMHIKAAAFISSLRSMSSLVLTEFGVHVILPVHSLHLMSCAGD